MPIQPNSVKGLFPANYVQPMDEKKLVKKGSVHDLQVKEAETQPDPPTAIPAATPAAVEEAQPVPPPTQPTPPPPVQPRILTSPLLKLC